MISSLTMILRQRQFVLPKQRSFHSSILRQQLQQHRTSSTSSANIIISTPPCPRPTALTTRTAASTIGWWNPSLGSPKLWYQYQYQHQPIQQQQQQQQLRKLSTTSTSTSTSSINEERPRRCILSVPGSDERKLQKATKIGNEVDAITLDLEDGVSYDNKSKARELVQEALMMSDDNRFDFGTAELCVRINGLNTDWVMDDLRAILPCPKLQAIVIPKVETSYCIEFVNDQIEMLAPIENRDNIRIIACIESAVGMMNIRDIASFNENNNNKSSCQRRLDALVFASEDYCADLELIRTPNATELLFARSLLVTTAKAYKLQAIDMVHIDFKNMIGLNVECQQGRELGFTGKQAIHPMQVSTIQKAFLPSEKDILFALEVVKEYEAAVSMTTTSTDGGGGESKGACVVQGIVVDAPVYKWAIKILSRADKAGILDEFTTKTE